VVGLSASGTSATSQGLLVHDGGMAKAAATELLLTVLVNEHTASASEILAGALKDNCRCGYTWLEPPQLNRVHKGSA
jgi:hypothetical protein